ncbi:hypothetical protein BN159_3573 [Streptomyces davaonensis JCM 4913]|uniref:Secreted protein n=1 Tax=Streptomyces davaonensis (strain DSM 101723 / JCM 4913 / KCC S-0913 / 768) TaxID=1214101 RepID=K4R4A4_STRDJ|nr:hypothetical protein [Streptomyces davaonensis]CCK27952.1 hypothetical protein BN159_3573 [Streptomyces davaonensis JCM 4913]
MRGRRGRAAARLALLGPVSAGLALCGGAPVAGAAGGSGARGPGGDAPDLAMVVAGGAGQPTAVRSGEQRFARLWQLLEPMYTGTERVPEAWVEGRHPPVRITVVWGLTGIGGWPETRRPPGGDVAIERQDQLVVAEDGTPWVRSDPAPEVDDDDIRWHRAPRSVFERLDRTGLLGGPVSGTEADGRGPATDAAWWAIPGLAVGFAAGVSGTVAIRRAAARPGAGPPREGPRQQLIDL